MFGVLGILVGVLCVLFGVLGCFVWAYLVSLSGEHYIFLANIIFIFFGVIGVCGVGMLYLLQLEFGMVHHKPLCRFVFLVYE